MCSYLTGSERCHVKKEDPGKKCPGELPKGLKRWSYKNDAVGWDGSDGCVEFKYLGCGGTANNFETKEECEKWCKGSGQKPTTPAPQGAEIVLSFYFGQRPFYSPPPCSSGSGCQNKEDNGMKYTGSATTSTTGKNCSKWTVGGWKR